MQYLLIVSGKCVPPTQYNTALLQELVQENNIATFKIYYLYHLLMKFSRSLTMKIDLSKFDRKQKNPVWKFPRKA